MLFDKDCLAVNHETTDSESNVLENKSYKTALHSEGVQEELILTNEIRHIYTDGCCIGNGKSGCFGGIGVYFGDNDSRNIGDALDVPEPDTN
jgi:ribonuclease HI